MTGSLHLVYLRAETMLVTRRAYASWREIQDAHEEYQASLGPWSPDELADYLRDEHPREAAKMLTAIEAWLIGHDDTLTLP